MTPRPPHAVLPRSIPAVFLHRTHARGLKFGLWIEPERVALQTVNRPRLARERYLATQDGRYDPATTTPRAAQVCLADDAARRWALDQLVALIDEVRPDYLKWDNNFWINLQPVAPSRAHVLILRIVEEAPDDGTRR